MSIVSTLYHLLSVDINSLSSALISSRVLADKLLNTPCSVLGSNLNVLFTQGWICLDNSPKIITSGQELKNQTDRNPSSPNHWFSTQNPRIHLNALSQFLSLPTIVFTGVH